MTAVAASNQHGIQDASNETSRSSSQGTAQSNQPSRQFEVLIGPASGDRQESNQGSTGDARYRCQSTKNDGTNQRSGRASIKRSPQVGPAELAHDPLSSPVEVYVRDAMALVGVEVEKGETLPVAKDLQSFAATLCEFVASQSDRCDFQIGGPATGTVWVSLRLHEAGGVCIEFHTTDISKRNQLDLHVPKLLASLRAQGINVISFTATSSDNSLAGESAPQSQNVIQPGEHCRKMSPFIPSTDAAENEDAIPSGTNIYTA